MSEVRPITNIRQVGGLNFAAFGFPLSLSHPQTAALAASGQLVMVSHRYARSVDPSTGLPNKRLLDILRGVPGSKDLIFWIDFLFFRSDLALVDRRAYFPEIWMLYSTCRCIIYATEADTERLWISAELSMIANGGRWGSSAVPSRVLVTEVDPKEAACAEFGLGRCVTDMMIRTRRYATENYLRLHEYKVLWGLLGLFLTQTTRRLGQLRATDPADLMWVTVSYFFVQLFAELGSAGEPNWLRTMLQSYDSLMRDSYDGDQGRLRWFFDWKVQVSVPWEWSWEIWDKYVLWDQDGANPRCFGEGGLKTFDLEWASALRQGFLEQKMESARELERIMISHGLI